MSGILQGVLASIGGAPATYIEDVFSTYLYTGNGGTQTITNGVDLAGKGGLVWFKNRNLAGFNHALFDTVRGVQKVLCSNNTTTQATETGGLTAFNSTGFTVGPWSAVNYNNTALNCSWTFREQAKFFDVVTFTNTNNTNQRVSHNLGSVPGMIFIKCTDTAESWPVYHRSLGRNFVLVLDDTTSSLNVINYWGTSDPTSTDFGINSQNLSGTNYVAYLFAHDAGGFGAAGTDNVISCGSFTTDANGDATVNLGYEPQYILYKRSSSTGSWYIFDNMRGMANQGSTAATPTLFANVSNAETANAAAFFATATGFQMYNQEVSSTLIYMAIRRGPMKTPTSGTSVFQPVRYAGNNATGRTISTGKTFATDWLMTWDTDNGAFGTTTAYSCPGITRLAGFGVNPPYLRSTNGTAAEYVSVVTITLNNSNYDYTVGGSSGNLNSTGSNYTHWNFGRAPGFFDVVCYTGNSTAGATQAHNLGVVPEMMIVKSRSAGSTNWRVYTATTGNGNELIMNTTDASGATTNWNSTTPTSSVFSLGGGASVNSSGTTYVAYLFATLAGVSKVGSYTGTGATQTINCGFTGGARWVMIKRTDSTGDWWVWDTATGMVAGSDTRIAINETAQIINQNWVYTVSTGFEIVTTDASVNASGGSYIYLAIA